MAELRQNTWILDEWYDQDVAGNVTYKGATSCWVVGNNAAGMLGQNVAASNHKSSPVQVPGSNYGGPSSIVNIKLSAGVGETFRQWLKSDGTFWGAGGGAGKLGQNNNTAYSSPRQLGTGSDWRSLDSSWANTVASKTDGTLWAWGENSYGTLGQNNETVYSSPRQIPGSTWGEWVATSSNSNATFCIKTDGTLWGWGRNAFGGIAQNSTSSSAYSSPVQIPGDWGSPVDMESKSIIKSDGTLWCWGWDGYGVLGQNTPATSRSSPIQIAGAWSKITRNIGIQLAIRTDGTLWSWGRNDNGALGLNDVAHRSSPTQVPGTWASVETDLFTVAATKTDGTLWTWGDNEGTGGGQLGQNNRTDYSSPMQVGTDTDYKHVGAVSSTGFTVFRTV